MGPKIVFLGKSDLLTENSKFRYKTIHADNVSRILPSLVEIGKAEVTKPVSGIHDEKNNRILARFSGAPIAM